MRRLLGTIAVTTTLALGGFAATGAAAATTGVGAPEPDKPLGTLWYPGPYVPPGPAPAPAAPQPQERPPAPAPAARPAPPAASVPTPPPVGAPAPDKPLGTLWYPGAYDPKRPAARPLPAPVLDPEPAPVTPPVPDRKPLGTLWYPGPYVPGAPAGPVPVPTAEPGPTAAPAPAPKATPAPTPGPAPVAQPAAPEAPRPAPGSGIDTDLPVHLSADEMSYDREQGRITATGNVEVIHGQRRLVADTITYDQNADVVSASGNIQLTEPGGERVFGDRMEVSGDLKDAIVESIGIILTDQARIAATGARRSGGLVTEMRKGVYSPCNLCKTDPERPPFWQVKAVRIIHDKTSKTIEYRDAWLEMFGVPVAYTPYLSHPDPTVKRKTGFLAPSFGNSSDLGFVGQVPYYYNISPQSDATVTAFVTSDQGSGGVAEYRRRFRTGTLDLTGSLIGGDTEEDIRGHIKGEGRFDIDDTWRWGFDVHRTTDDTYLRRYGFGAPDSLNSRLFAEGFRKRNYLAINGYTFQGLRLPDDPGQEPLILPIVDYNHLGEPDRFGGQTKLDVNLLSLTRNDGTNTRRFSFRPGWQLPFIGPLGDAYKLSVDLNADLYYVNDLARENQTRFTGFSSRVVPQAMLDWRYPFVREGPTVSQIVEPVAVAVYSPYGGNPDEIPNEDSTELEFDDTNLLGDNKFSGIDRVEGGPRVNYGVKWGLYGKGGGSTAVFLGQSWRPREDDTFAAGSGLDENFSDLVGRVAVAPGPHLNLVYRTRFDSDNFTPKRNEVTLQAGAPALRVYANYLFIESQQGSEFPGREEIIFSGSSQVNRFWRFGLRGVRDLAVGEMRSIGAQLVYENECVILTTDASRTFFEDRDLEPTDQITFNVVLKTIGEVRTDIFQQ